jgi:hypothetical protein
VWRGGGAQEGGEGDHQFFPGGGAAAGGGVEAGNAEDDVGTAHAGEKLVEAGLAYLTRDD